MQLNHLLRNSVKSTEGKLKAEDYEAAIVVGFHKITGQELDVEKSGIGSKTMKVLEANPAAKMMDEYLQNADAPNSFEGRFYPTSYQWGGWDNPVAVNNTEMMLWEQADEQPEGYTFFNGDSKAEHPAVDPDINRTRYVQNMTNKGGILGFRFWFHWSHSRRC